MPTEFTRLTIIGTDRKADLVVPTDEAVGGLLPRMMDLRGEASGSVGPAVDAGPLDR